MIIRNIIYSEIFYLKNVFGVETRGRNGPTGTRWAILVLLSLPVLMVFLRRGVARHPGLSPARDIDGLRAGGLRR
jgi:hypothetical protein